MFHIASRMRLGAVIALPAVAAVMAFAPSADAAIFTPTNGAQLMSDISAANSAGGSNEIILAASTTYFPTAPMTITAGDFLEITGPPQNPATQQTKLAVVSGLDVVPLQSNTFTVAPGAFAIFKGFETEQMAANGFAGFEVNGTGEFDNMGISGSAGNGIELDSTVQTASAVVNDSLVADGDAFGVQDDLVSNLLMNNDTVADNAEGGITGDVDLNNTLVANNAGSGGGSDCLAGIGDGGTVTATNSIDDDGTCAAATTNGGVTTDTLTSLHLSGTKFNGGPTASEAITSASTAFGAGSGCFPVDQRFFSGATTCSVGSYQVTTATAANTTAPTCTVSSINESSNPSVASTEVVNAADGGAGLGPDAISGATTTNGTVGWPVIAGTPYDETTPGNAAAPDLDTAAAFPVTATKPVGDLTAGDTHWSFTATSWAGIAKLCS